MAATRGRAAQRIRLCVHASAPQKLVVGEAEPGLDAGERRRFGVAVLHRHGGVGLRHEQQLLRRARSGGDLEARTPITRRLAFKLVESPALAPRPRPLLPLPPFRSIKPREAHTRSETEA